RRHFIGAADVLEQRLDPQPIVREQVVLAQVAVEAEHLAHRFAQVRAAQDARWPDEVARPGGAGRVRAMHRHVAAWIGEEAVALGIDARERAGVEVDPPRAAPGDHAAGDAYIDGHDPRAGWVVDRR